MAMESNSELCLDRLQPYQCGVIAGVDGDDDDMERLRAMGVCRGRVVELIQRGDPLIIKVLGTRIGISARLARKVVVHSDTHEGCPLHETPEERDLS